MTASRSARTSAKLPPASTSVCSSPSCTISSWIAVESAALSSAADSMFKTAAVASSASIAMRKSMIVETIRRRAAKRCSVRRRAYATISTASASTPAVAARVPNIAGSTARAADSLSERVSAEDTSAGGVGVGNGVGAVLGNGVGAAVGTLVGGTVGDAVGAAVGATVGDMVGADVGAGVGAAVQGSQKPWSTQSTTSLHVSARLHSERHPEMPCEQPQYSVQQGKSRFEQKHKRRTPCTAPVEHKDAAPPYPQAPLNERRNGEFPPVSLPTS